MGCKVGGGKLKKAEKKTHAEIHVMADSKLNTISDHIFKTLKDHAMSDDQLRMILDKAKTILG